MIDIKLNPCLGPWHFTPEDIIYTVLKNGQVKKFWITPEVKFGKFVLARVQGAGSYGSVEKEKIVADELAYLISSTPEFYAALRLIAYGEKPDGPNYTASEYRDFAAAVIRQSSVRRK